MKEQLVKLKKTIEDVRSFISNEKNPLKEMEEKIGYLYNEINNVLWKNIQEVLEKRIENYYSKKEYDKARELENLYKEIDEKMFDFNMNRRALALGDIAIFDERLGDLLRSMRKALFYK